jgi:hypothetical protein
MIKKLQLQFSEKIYIMKSLLGYELLILQGEHKRTSHFQNDIENKCSVLRTSHLHQSIEKNSKFCTHLTETRCVLCESHGRCRDDTPAYPKLCGECP